MLEGHLPLPSLDQKYMVHAINPFVFSNIFNPAPKTHVNLIVLVLISVGKKKQVCCGDPHLSGFQSP